MSRRLNGDKRPRPPGRAMNACRNFATKDLKSLNGMPRLRFPNRIQPCRIVRSLARFSSSSHNVFCLPSKSKPKRVLDVEYYPSPLSSFFSDIGSFASTMLAGKTSCMPVVIAVATCWSCCWEVGMTMLMKSSIYTSRA